MRCARPDHRFLVKALWPSSVNFVIAIRDRSRTSTRPSPDALLAIVAKLMSKSPSDRYQSAGEVEFALNELLSRTVSTGEPNHDRTSR